MSSAPSQVGQTLHHSEGTSGGQVIRLEDLRGRVVDRLVLPVLAMAGPANPGAPAAPPAPEPLTPQLVLAILDRARLGIPAFDLAAALDRPVAEVERCWPRRAGCWR